MLINVNRLTPAQLYKCIRITPWYLITFSVVSILLPISIYAHMIVNVVIFYMFYTLIRCSRRLKSWLDFVRFMKKVQDEIDKYDDKRD